MIALALRKSSALFLCADDPIAKSNRGRQNWCFGKSANLRLSTGATAMAKSSFLATVVLFQLLVLTFSTAQAFPEDSVPVPEGERPNVLFISVDDLNDWVGCMGGHPQSRTPNIDRLANSGCLFTNAHLSLIHI